MHPLTWARHSCSLIVWKAGLRRAWVFIDNAECRCSLVILREYGLYAPWNWCRGHRSGLSFTISVFFYISISLFHLPLVSIFLCTSTSFFSICVCLSSLPLPVSVYVPACLPLCLSVCLSLCLSVFVCVRLPSVWLPLIFCPFPGGTDVMDQPISSWRRAYYSSSQARNRKNGKEDNIMYFSLAYRGILVGIYYMELISENSQCLRSYRYANR